jgi:hypothetical protein
MTLLLSLWACAETSPQSPLEAVDAGFDSQQPVAPLPVERLERLSGTGLYAGDNAAAGLSPGVLEYSPRFEQWVDGAALRRFVWLPPAATIDSSDPDHWLYPTGTRAWQELTRAGVRVETRFMEKLGPRDWRFRTYYWAEQDEALAVDNGLSDAGGTGHDIPHLVDCGSCHENVSDGLLGFTALELDHDAAGSSLEGLLSSGRLSTPLATATALPGDEVTQAALGYLHANCGSCHNPNSVEYRSVDLELWLSLDALGSLEDTPVYRTAVGIPRRGLGAASALPRLRIAPGNPDESAVVRRMASRDPNVQMPPIATKLVDADALEHVASWIRGLTPP